MLLPVTHRNLELLHILNSGIVSGQKCFDECPPVWLSRMAGILLRLAKSLALRRPCHTLLFSSESRWRRRRLTTITTTTTSFLSLAWPVSRKGGREKAGRKWDHLRESRNGPGANFLSPFLRLHSRKARSFLSSLSLVRFLSHSIQQKRRRGAVLFLPSFHFHHPVPALVPQSLSLLARRKCTQHRQPTHTQRESERRRQSGGGRDRSQFCLSPREQRHADGEKISLCALSQSWNWVHCCAIAPLSRVESSILRWVTESVQIFIIFSLHFANLLFVNTLYTQGEKVVWLCMQPCGSIRWEQVSLSSGLFTPRRDETRHQDPVGKVNLSRVGQSAESWTLIILHVPSLMSSAFSCQPPRRRIP